MPYNEKRTGKFHQSSSRMKTSGKETLWKHKKRWIDIVEEDLKNIGLNEWREIIYYRDRWCDVVLTAKTLRGHKKTKKCVNKKLNKKN